MKRGIGILVGQMSSAVVLAFLARPTVVACAPSNGAASQAPTVSSDRPLLLAQGETFRERLQKREDAKIDEVSAQLQKNPNLIDDQKYLAQHPRLADYIANHPDAKAKIKQDPKAFFQQLKERGAGMGG